MIKIYDLKKAIYVIGVIFFAVSCKKSELFMYKQDARIYFYRGNAINFSFADQPFGTTADTLYVPIRIIGFAEHRDRPFKLKVVDTSTAIQGYHYNFGPMSVPADSFTYNFPVYLYRRKGLQDSTVTIYMTLDSSAEFKLGWTDIYNTTLGYTQLQYSISITDKIIKPADWDTKWVVYFGDYSRTKHSFITNTYHAPTWISLTNTVDINALVQNVKYALYNYELANGPLYDENNMLVEFP